MPENGTTRERIDDVLTLEEAATFLRVAPDRLARQAEEGGVPARFVAGEWRFLKSGLTEWLRVRPNGTEDRRLSEPLPFDYLAIKELLDGMERRLADRDKSTEPPKPIPGTWAAIAPYVGILKDEEDKEGCLARLREIRAEGNR